MQWLLRVWAGIDCLLKVHCVCQIVHDYFEMPCVTLAVFGVAGGCLAEVRKPLRRRRGSFIMFVSSMHNHTCGSHGPLCWLVIARHSRHAMRG